MLAKLEDSQPFSEHYDKCVSKRTFYNSSMRCLVDSGFIIRLEDRKMKITYQRSKEDENKSIESSHSSFSGRKQTHKITRIVMFILLRLVFIFHSLRRMAGTTALFWRENQCTVLTKSGFRVSQWRGGGGPCSLQFPSKIAQCSHLPTRLPYLLMCPI